MQDFKFPLYQSKLNLQDAIQTKSFYSDPTIFAPNGSGNPLGDAVHVIEGDFETGLQKHMYMETNGCITVPKGENGELDVYITSQFPSMLHVSKYAFTV